MSELEIWVADQLLQPMYDWSDNCQNDGNIRINNSIQVQIFEMLRNIKRVVPCMDSYTYDINADVTAEEKGLDTIWFALAFYLSKFQGGKDREAYHYAESMWKSIRSGVFSLQTTSMSTNSPLFVTAHMTDNRDTKVVTFNGDYTLQSGVSAVDMVDSRSKKKWTDSMKALLSKKGVQGIKANQVIDAVTTELNHQLGYETQLKLD